MARGSSRRGHGEGGIFFIEARDRWAAELDYGYVAGKRKRVRRTFRSRREASAWLTSALKAQAEGVPAPDGRTKLGDFAQRWLIDVVEPSDRRANTKVSYAAAVRLHISPSLGHHKLIDLRHEHVQRFLNEMRAKGSGKSLMRTVRVVLVMILDEAIREERLTRNVATTTAVPEPLIRREPPRRLTLEERGALLAAVQTDPLYALYHLLGIGGLRRGEVLGIRLTDVDFARNQLQITQQIVRVTGQGLVTQPPKRGSARSLYLSDATAEVLRKRIQDRERQRAECGAFWTETGLLFTTGHGTALDPARINHHMREACKRAGIPHAAPHSLRRAFADIAHDLGVRDKDLQAALGHSAIQITMDTYVSKRTTTDANFADIVERSLPDLRPTLADTLADTGPGKATGASPA